MAVIYAALLLITIGCFVLIDRRYKLAFFYKPKRSAITIAVVMLVFIIWDILGISLGIFFDGPSPYMLGWYVGPHFPVEEILFLFLLTYMPLVLYRLAEKKWPRT